MKKKLVALIVCFAVLFAAGCSSTPVAEPFDTELPWGVADYAYEKSVYSLTIYEPVITDSVYTDGAVLAKGTYSETLKADGGAGSANLITVNTELNAQWENTEKAGENKNAADSIISEVTFKRKDLSPVKSGKTAELEARYKADKSFLQNNSYEYTVDYAAHTSSVRLGKNAQGEWLKDAKNITVRKDLSYDNAQLFSLIRAFKNFKAGASISFSMNNAVESYIRGKNDLLSMTLSVAADPVSKTLDSFILDYSDTDTFDCLVANVSLNETYPGPVHKFYIAEPGRSFQKKDSNLKTAKLVVGYEYMLFDTEGNAKYHYVYTLTDYESR